MTATPKASMEEDVVETAASGADAADVQYALEAEGAELSSISAELAILVRTHRLE